MTNNYLQFLTIKNLKKDSKKKHAKDIPIFLKKKQTKGKKKVQEKY